jgi:hypothetical protein
MSSVCHVNSTFACASGEDKAGTLRLYHLLLTALKPSPQKTARLELLLRRYRCAFLHLELNHGFRYGIPEIPIVLVCIEEYD